jgi:hypothetical protein
MSPGEVRQLVAEPLTGVVAEHGEGPLWDERSGRLLSMDMLAGALLLTDPATGDTSGVRSRPPWRRWPVRRGTGTAGSSWGSARSSRPTPDLTAFEQVGALPVPEGVRANDGGCDPSGRLYVGTMAYDQSPGAGDLFVRQLDGAVEVALSGVTISNGLCFGPEPSTPTTPTPPPRRWCSCRSTPAVMSARSGPWSRSQRARRAGRPDRRRRRRHLGGPVGRGAGAPLHGRRGARRPGRAAGAARDLLRLRRAGLTELYITTSRYELEGDTGPAGAVFRCTPGQVGVLPLPAG